MIQRRRMAALGVAVCMIGSPYEALAAEAGALAAEQLSAMSREEKAGQMLMVTPGQLYGSGDWIGDIAGVVQLVNQYHIGGIVLFDEDLQNTEAVSALAQALEEGSTAAVPVLLAAGAGGSLTEGFVKPSLEDPSVLETGELASGSQVVWAYSLVSEPGEAYAALGLDAAFVPGSGGELAVVTHDKAKNPLDDGRPASMSRSMITGLREEGAFSGVVMTDSLGSSAATDSYGADMAAIYALQAGADILIAPAHPAMTCAGILSSIDEQLVTEEQINASVQRILTMKAELIE